MPKLVVSVVVVVLAALAGACSSGSDTDDVAPPPPTPPTSTGDACVDVAGDVTLESTVVPEAEGIDILEAAAEVVGDELLVEFTTAGPIALAPAPSFVVAQGNPFDPFSFEVRAVRDDGTGNWAITLITWDQNEQKRAIVTQPAVEDSTLSFAIPTADLPPLATYLQFGASSDLGEGGIAIDDCSSLSTETTS